MGLPELRAESSLPRLRLVLNGITRARMSDDRTLRSKPRLPITVDILHRIFTVLSRGSPSYTDHLVWAACALSFFGFFRAGEITVPSQSVLQQSKHLGWGDVCVDSIFSPSLLRVHLKVSKCDQFGSGADIYIGKTSDEICPVAACLSYMQLRGHQAGPFFCFRKNIPLTKGTFVAHVRKALTQAGLDASLYSGHSFCIGAATSAAQAGCRGFGNQGPRPMVKCSILVIYSNTKGEVDSFFCCNQWSCTEVTLGLYFHVHSYCEIVLVDSSC